VTRPQFLADLQETQAKIQLHYFKSDEARACLRAATGRRLLLPPKATRPSPFPPCRPAPRRPASFSRRSSITTRKSPSDPGTGNDAINFTPGTRSNADYTGEADRNFVPSSVIYDSILARERQDPNGLNGFICCSTSGPAPAGRTSSTRGLAACLDVLAAKGYEFVRVDELLDSDHTGGLDGRTNQMNL
jgi:hypothetical protein